MPLHQSAAPLFEALQDYRRRAPAIFHVPGHKQGRGAPTEWRSTIGRQALAIDLTEAPGLDDLHAPEGVIAQAQALAAKAFRAGSSHFLVGGSTAGLHAMILAAARPGETVLVPRNAHRSVLGAIILAGVNPIWIQPEYAEGLDIALGLRSGTVTEMVADHPSTRALLLVHPTFYGITSPLREQIGAAHAAGVAVIADEAHGTHFSFAPRMPEPALAAGVDGTVQSLHKTGGSLTQSALCHLAQGSRISPTRLQEMLRLVQTTSPSYILMASLDVARRDLVLRGEALWTRAVELAARVRERLGGLVYSVPAGYTADPTKVVVDVRNLKMTGFAAARQLWEQGVAVESAGYGFFLLVLSPGDTRTSVDRLLRAVRSLRAEGSGPSSLGPPPRTVSLLSPREAYLGAKQSVPLASAVDRVAAELVAPYPPGIPVLVPGERVTGETVAFLTRAVQTGHHLQGPADPSLRTIQVVKE